VAGEEGLTAGARLPNEIAGTSQDKPGNDKLCNPSNPNRQP
jgi:hypothetical protein